MSLRIRSLSPRLSTLAELRRLRSLSAPYRLRLFLGVGLTLAAGTLSLLVPLGVRSLVNSVLTQTERSHLDRIALAMLVLFAALASLQFGGRYLLEWTGDRIVNDLRLRVYAHLHRLSHRFFGAERIGDLISRLTNDVALLQTAATGAFAELGSTAFKLVGSAALLVAINWRLGALILAVVPGSYLVSRRCGRTMRRLSRDTQDRLADATAVAQEALTGIRAVLAFARGAYEVGRYRRKVELLFDAQRRRALADSAFGSGVALLLYSSIAAIFWFGGREVLSGRLTVGDLVASLFYAFAIAQGLIVMASLYGFYSRAAGASERLFELLDIKPEIEDAQGAIALSSVRGHIRLEHVSFGYIPWAPVLHEVNLEVIPGEVVAIVGPTGAGKSTLVQLIPRFYDADRGRVTIDGVDVRSVTMASLREQVALVSQEIDLFDTSVRENIRYGRLDATDAEVERAADAASVHEFITSLPSSYDTVIGERGVRLSGGERQRLALARAMLKDAPILLLDEATASLDAITESRVKEALSRTTRQRSVIMVAHRLATVRDADRILLMSGGRIVEQGTHETLMAAGGLYAALAAQQSLDARVSAAASDGRRGAERYEISPNGSTPRARAPGAEPSGRPSDASNTKE